MTTEFAPSAPPRTVGGRLFEAPAAGRRILAGFSYLQRIGKNASTRVWFPEKLNGETIEWAAVRQFELLQEASNFTIEDLEVTDLERAFFSWGKMRAGGYRVTVMTLGRYVDTPETDDLYVLDQKLQEEITRMINFLYLSEQSGEASAALTQDLSEGTWKLADALPHVAMAIGEKRLFKPQRETQTERAFFEILGRLPAKHVRHDVALGLSLPDATKEKQWIYLAAGERKQAAFFAALGDTIGTMINAQMRAHGDRLKPEHEIWRREMAQSLRLAA